MSSARRLLSALAGTTPAFSPAPVDGAGPENRRLLSALAASTAAFNAAPTGEYRIAGSESTPPAAAATSEGDSGAPAAGTAAPSPPEPAVGTAAEQADPDQAARLHDALTLHGPEAVVDELTDLLSELPTSAWLALFDAVVATPDPQRPYEEAVANLPRLNSRRAAITRLLTVVPVLNLNPQLSTPLTRQQLSLLAVEAFEYLAQEHTDADLLRAAAVERSRPSD